MQIEKRLLIPSLFIFLCFLCIANVSATCLLEIEDKNVEKSINYVEIPIFISDNTINISGIVFSIEYERDVLNLSTIEGGDLTQVWDEYHKTYNDSVRIVIVGDESNYLVVNTYGVVIKAQFQVVNSTDTWIRVANASVSDEEGNLYSNISIKNMNLTFVSPTPSPTPTPTYYYRRSGGRSRTRTTSTPIPTSTSTPISTSTPTIVPVVSIPPVIHEEPFVKPVSIPDVIVPLVEKEDEKSNLLVYLLCAFLVGGTAFLVLKLRKRNLGGENEEKEGGIYWD